MPRRLIIVSFLLVTLSPESAQAGEYEIQYLNRARQTLTSSVCAVHRRGSSIFRIGKEASPGLRNLAQDGVESDFRSELQGKISVRATKTGGFVASSSSGRLRMSVRSGMWLSCVFGMLVATNDGFVAARAVRLPKLVGQTTRFRATVYDAGSEVNTESCEHVPGGPCGAHFMGISEGETIQPHAGILGIAELSADQHGWPRNAVSGIVTRVR